MKRRYLVIDADGIIYRHAAAAEVELPSEEVTEDGLPLYISLSVNPGEVEQAFWNEVEALQQAWRADEVMVAITDSAQNFRLSIDPSYKGHRAHVRKPLAVRTVRRRLADNPAVYYKPTLEADDTCGILMGLPRHRGDTMILWSPDKDLDGVPGIHADVNSSGKTYHVTREEADEWHLIQTVAGDTTDGYPGVPGIGPTTAKKYFDENGASWKSCVELASMAGMPYADLLVQARLAKMLEPRWYDFKKKVPVLWEPPAGWQRGE